jgi:RNA polymerase sigma-70 factor, ECF subfamily
MRSEPAGGLACNDVDGFGQLVSVTGVRHSVGSLPATVGGSVDSRAAAEFELFYRANVGATAAFFARRCSEPQLVADLTSEVFLQALASLDSFDPDRGSARGWLFGIARRVWAQHCERAARGREAITALAAHRQLGDDEIEDIAIRIDAQRTARELLARLAGLSEGCGGAGRSDGA